MKAIILVIFLLFFCNTKCYGINKNYTKLYQLTNEKRVEFKLKPLKYNIKLEKSATIKACDILNRNYWSHKDPDGKYSWYLFRKVGYKYSKAGENLAKDFKTDEEIIEAFMKSKTHKEVLLNKYYKDIGIGKCGNITVFHFGML